MKSYLKIARFDHWIKQLFILPGSVFALLLLKQNNVVTIDAGITLLNIALCFVSTCFIASANYVINEWLDAEFDKYHPIKKNRPVVTQNMSAKIIILMYILFAIAGLVLAYTVAFSVLVAEGALLLMGVLYNVSPIRLKDIPYLDVLSESINNAIRFIIGWLCVTSTFLPPSSIVIGYWMGGAFLMAVKRFAEFRMINDVNQAALYRKSFGKYSENSLLLSSIFYALLSIFFVGIFMVKYRIELLILIPFLCALYCLYLGLAYKPDSSVQKPEKLFKEKSLMLLLAVIIVLFAILMMIRIPELSLFLDNSLIQLPDSWDYGRS